MNPHSSLHKVLTKDLLIREYIDNRLSTTEIGRKYNCHRDSVLFHLRKNNIPRRSSQEGHIKHFFNRAYFTTPNINNCYWAGLIAADGCLTKSNKTYALALSHSIKDKIILKAFQKAINFTGNISETTNHSGFSNNSTFSRISLNNIDNDIFKDLNKYWNITPRKTFTLKPPADYITDDLALAYIIGYTDGDGCCNYHKNRNNCYFAVKLLGTRAVMLWINEKLTNEVPPINNRVVNVNKYNNTFSLEYHGQRAELIHKRLRSIPLDFRLPRKWNITYK